MSSPSKLIKLDSLTEARVWNYEKPTLVQEGRFTSRLPTKRSETFRDIFYQHYSALKGLGMENVVFKGGSILDLLLGQSANDLDLFLIGLDSDELALERVKQLLHNFLEIEKNHVREKQKNEEERCKKHNISCGQKFQEEIKAFRRGNVITLRLSAVHIPIQIVLVRYANVQDCLEDDDLGATAIAFDGREVWLNERSKFSMENLTIMLDPTRLAGLAPSRRIEKYFNKGFDIVLPQLDIGKLPRHYQEFPTLCDAAELPGLVFSYKAVRGNKIILNEFIHTEKEKTEEEMNAQKYQRAYGRYSDEDDKNSRAGILAENIFKLCNEQWEEFGVYAEGDYLLDVLKIWPGIHPRQINNFYHRFKKQMVVGTTFNFAIAKQYFVMYSVADIATKLFNAKKMEDELKQLTREHIQRAEQKLKEWLAKGRTEEMVVVKSRGTGAEQEELYPHLYKEPKQFYGDFFKAGE